MIYGQDEPMLFPVANLYDSGMMQMYINAAREQYNQNREDMKEFRKLYGDFTSPFAEDIAWVDQQTRGRINDALNYMQANGIDPLRSAEGRALIQQIINNTDTAGINLRKQAAANKILWDKSIADLRAKNLYNKDFVDWEFAQRHKGVTPDKWSTKVNGLWTDTSVDPYQDLNTATKSWYDQMEKGYLYTDDDGYEWWGNSEDDVRNVAKQHLPDLTSPYWQYQKYIAGLMAGPGASDEDIQKQFEDNLVAAASEVYTRPERKESLDRQRAETLKYNNASERFKTNESIRQYGAQQAIAHKYKVLEAAYQNLDSSSNSSSGSSGSATSSAMAMGVEDQLTTQQILNESNNREDFISAYEIASKNAFVKQKQLYDKLTNEDKKIAVQYGKDYRTLQNDKSTKEQKDAAQRRINSYNNKKDSRFVAWKNQFTKRMNNYSMNAEVVWTQYNNTEGFTGGNWQTSEELYQKSLNIFNKNNIVEDLHDDQKKDLNKRLGYINDEDGVRTGVMRKNRDLSAVVMAEMTGNRKYRYSSIPEKVSRIIKGKQYKVENADIIERKYGSGVVQVSGMNGGRRYNIISEIATFKDADVIKQLDAIGEKELNKYGIKKVDGYWKIPIITKLGYGQGRAETNQSSIKRRQGAAGGAKADYETQAAEITQNMVYRQ